MQPPGRVFASRVALVLGIVALVLAFAVPNLLALRLRSAQAGGDVEPAPGGQSRAELQGDVPVAQRDAP